MFSKWLFINIYKVHLGPGTHVFVVTVQHVYQTVCIFIFLFPERPLVLVPILLWLHLSSDVFSMVDIWSLVFFLVLQGVLSNILVFYKNFEGYAPFLSLPLRLFVSDIFRGGTEDVGRLCDNSWSSWLVYSVWYSCRSLILFPGFYFHHSLAGVSLAGFSYRGTCDKGAQKLSEGLICDCDKCPM